MSKKKRNLIVSGCAVVLAVSLALGGATYTYLSSMSESVTNTFNPNSVEIFLEESGDQEYEIIPGTSEEKDPTVTVTSTVDSYLYVLVYGNNPTFTYHDGTTYVNGGTIITYEIEDGWTALAYDYDSDNDGTPDSYSDKVLANFVWAELTESDTTVTIYYREVSASDEEQVFHVLKDDVVSYSENIESLDGYEDGDIYLAFAAYAIQQKPFSSAADALTQTVVNTASGLTTAIAAGEAVTLSSSISVSASEINSAIDSADDSTAEIDLNGETLTIESGTISLVSGEAITLSNGTVEYTGTYNTVVSMYTGSEFTMENVVLNTNATINVEAGTDTSTLNIINSTINSTDNYCLSTNAANNATGSSVIINVVNSELTVVEDVDADFDSTAILFNIPGTLNITDSTITGERQGVIVRCGTANITDSTIKTTAEYSAGNYYLDSTWKSGNEVPMAALVVGNRSGATSYPYDATVTLSNVTLTVAENTQSVSVPAIYAANCAYSTTITGAADTDKVLYYVGDENSGVSINGKSVTGSTTSLITVADITQ